MTEEEAKRIHWEEFYRLRRENADLELARKVADAAVAGHIVWGAFSRIYFAEPVDYEARAELLRALGETRDAMAVAVREYRERVEGVE